MDLSKAVFVRFDPKLRRESGPYEVSALTSYQFGPGAVGRFDGEEKWWAIPEIVEAFENSPASETQRQRLRKRGVVFDESKVTRREARELYRNTPDQKAKQATRDNLRTERDRKERAEALAAARGAGFLVPDDIDQADLEPLSWGQPPDPQLESALRSRVARLVTEGFELTVPRVPTKEDIERLSETVEEFIETSEGLVDGFRYEVDTDCLSREPTEDEIHAMQKVFLSTLVNGEWDGTTQSLAKMLCSVSPGMLYSVDGNCSPPPLASGSRVTLRIWGSDGYSYHTVVVALNLGDVTAICDCKAAKMKWLCRHVKAVLAGDVEALWDRSQAEVLTRAKEWLDAPAKHEARSGGQGATS
jgi:hypothetical protein